VLASAGRHDVVAGRNPSRGQIEIDGEQTSGRSHTPATGRHVIVGATVAESARHTPFAPPVSAAEHAWQSIAPPPQAEPQHTPSTQKPLRHVEPLEHDAPFTSALRIVKTRALPASAPPAVSS
jgi:hypothetical protein